MSFSPMPVQLAPFEDICAHLMSHIAHKNKGLHAKYRPLGVNGQMQWGLDIVTDHPECAGIVAQCKHKKPGSVLKFSEIQQDLRKTDGYKGEINRFFVLTNSERDSVLQSSTVNFWHQRPNGTSFPVQVIYWSDLTDLSFIPKEKLRLYFPEQAYHARHFLPPLDMRAVAAAYDAAPMVRRHWFSDTDISEILDSASTLHLSAALWTKMNLFQQAVAAAQVFGLGEIELGQRPCVRSLFMIYPVVEGFARVLLEYKKIFADVEGSNPRDPAHLKRLQELQRLAEAVASRYGVLCEGDNGFDEELKELKAEALRSRQQGL